MRIRTIKISAKENESLQAFLDSSGSNEIETKRTFTACFEKDLEADIKVCCGRPPFVDAILFFQEEEVSCISDAGDDLLGEYIFEYCGEELKVIVEVG